MRSIIIAVACAFFSCASSQNTAVQVPSDLVIRYAEGGGFTGQWTGTVIRSDGSVHTWLPRSGDSLGTRIGTLSPASIASLWRSVETRKLFELAGSKESGNMTRSISLTAGKQAVDASWPVGPSVSESSKPFAAFYDECRRAVAQLKP